MTDGKDAQAKLAGGRLDFFVGYNLKRAYMIMQADFKSALGADGLGPRVFSALCLVVEFPHITQSALARKLGIERSGLVALVDELEDRGFLSRTTVPGDRRVQALVPTSAGIAASEAAYAKVKAHEQILLAEFSAQDRALLIDLLQRIRACGEGDAD